MMNGNADDPRYLVLMVAGSIAENAPVDAAKTQTSISAVFDPATMTMVGSCVLDRRLRYCYVGMPTLVILTMLSDFSAGKRMWCASGEVTEVTHRKHKTGRGAFTRVAVRYDIERIYDVDLFNVNGSFRRYIPTDKVHAAVEASILRHDAYEQ